MFKASYRFLFALLLACCAAGSGLFWPRFVDAAVPLTGWARADLMPPQSGLIALPVVLFSVAALGMFMLGIFALIDAGSDETKRLHAQDARADRLGHELEDLQRDFETQQGALRAALLERTQLREENARQGHEIAKLKAERAAGGAGLITGPFISGVGGNGAGGSVTAFGPGFQSVLSQLVKMQPDEQKRMELVTRSPNNYTIRVPAGTRSCKILWPNGEVTVYDAEKGAWPEKMKEGAPEPAAVGGQVPYRIKAEPLKISDLREGDEVVFLGPCSSAGLRTITIGHVREPGNDFIGVRAYGRVSQTEVLGVLRRIGS